MSAVVKARFPLNNLALARLCCGVAWCGTLACAQDSITEVAQLDAGGAEPDSRADAGVPLIGTPYAWELPEGLPLPVIPETNPMTEEKVELGRHLFYDRRLSFNEELACSSCHEQARAFADGRDKSFGATGELVPRNSPGLANVAYRLTLTWMNPTLLTLESQIPVPLFGEFPTELGANQAEDAVLERFRESELYRGLFREAFGDGAAFNFQEIVDALACFCRSLISGTSPYDRYVRGDPDAVSDAAKRGLAMFFEENLECHHCHNGFDLTNSVRSERTRFPELAYFNTGLYSLDAEGRYPDGGEGLFEFTGDPADYGKFRTPSLRNVALTGPYMHDGSVATLEEVLQIYAAGGRNIVAGDDAAGSSGELVGDGRLNPNRDGFVHGFALTDEDMADVLAFLHSLTDDEFVHDPRHADPFQ